MGASLSVFSFDGSDVRTVVTDGELWWVAADVASVLGYSATSAMVRTLDPDEKGVRTLHTPGGDQQFIVISEPGLFSAILRSRVNLARRFQRWVTHEVLPAIRKTGSYGASPAIPQSLPEALRAYALEVEQREALEAKVAADAPKVLFAESVSASSTAILVRELAVILRGNGVMTGEKRLYETLREDGFLIKREGTDYNMPTQKSMELGLFRVKETAITHADGRVTVSKTPKITGKGQTYFIERYGVAA